MLYLIVTAAFQHIQVTHKVGIRIGVGIFQRIAHPSLGGKVDNAVELLCGEQRRHAFAIRQIQLLKAELRGVQQIQPRLLEADIVIVIKVINPDDLMPRL